MYINLKQELAEKQADYTFNGFFPLVIVGTTINQNVLYYHTADSYEELFNEMLQCGDFNEDRVYDTYLNEDEDSEFELKIDNYKEAIKDMLMYSDRFHNSYQNFDEFDAQWVREV